MKREASQNVDAYIARFSGRTRELLERLRATIAAAAPGAEQKISYQIPTFALHGNLVHFAAFKSHIGFFPRASGIARFEHELRAYRSSKGGVQFPLDAPLPFALVRKIVRFRVRENAENAAAKRGKAARKAGAKAERRPAPQSPKRAARRAAPTAPAARRRAAPPG